MKLLYLSCHAILEYDELKLFEELGIDYFSLGSYIDPQRPADKIRPALKSQPQKDLIDKAPQKERLTREFVAPFDTIVVMHVFDWIDKNWPIIKDKRVIWRSIGQSTPELERRLARYRAEGLEVVRYSPREQFIQNNIGFDAMIRFYKDESEFGGWTGAENMTITFCQDIKRRGEFCNFDIWDKVTNQVNAKVYGRGNDGMGSKGVGEVTYEKLKQRMRDCKSYFYTGTQPASYTLNFIEALMTGIPIVAIGPEHGNSLNIAGPTYEVHEIIKNGINGFCSDDPKEIVDYLESLSKNTPMARAISRAGRETAIKLFGKETIKGFWKKYLRV